MSSSKHPHDQDEADLSHSPVEGPCERATPDSSGWLSDLQLPERTCSSQLASPSDNATPLKIESGSAAAVWPSGYYYQDSEGSTEGPCSLQDLQALQSHFQEASQMMIWVSDGIGNGYLGQLDQILYCAAAQQQSIVQQEQTALNAAPASVTATTHISNPAPTNGMPSANAYAEAVLAGAEMSWKFDQAAAQTLWSNVSMSACMLSCMTCLSGPRSLMRAVCIPVQSRLTACTTGRLGKPAGGACLSEHRPVPGCQEVIPPQYSHALSIAMMMTKST